MRVAYLAYWDMERDDGVARKIRTQVGRWRTAGHEVELVTFAPAPLRERLSLARAAAECVRRSGADVVYLRYDLFPPAVWLLPRRLPTAVELNTDTRAEVRLRSRAATAYDAANRRALIGPAAGVVAVAHELAPRGKRTLVLGNGLDPADVPPLAAPANARVRLLFIGSPRQRWQGFDKLLELARRLPEVEVDLVGLGADVLAPLPPNVRAHGWLQPHEYRPLLRSADAAAGTLALHRKRMGEASPLKVREYLLSGIPTMIAYDDTDLRGVEAPWLLRLPNTETNVLERIDEIAAFLERARGARVPLAQVEERLGAAGKETRRLEFLESMT